MLTDRSRVENQAVADHKRFHNLPVETDGRKRFVVDFVIDEKKRTVHCLIGGDVVEAKRVAKRMADRAGLRIVWMPERKPMKLPAAGSRPTGAPRDPRVYPRG